MTALPVPTAPAGAVAVRPAASLTAVLARAVAVGLATGVLLRYAMRLLATQPSFSWAMTGFIIGLSVLLWVCVDLAAHLVRTRGHRRWGLVALPGIVLFIGPGMLLLPGVLLTTLAGLIRSRVAQAVVALAGGVFTAILLTVLADDTILGPRTTWIGGALMSLLVIAYGVGLARVVMALRAV